MHLLYNIGISLYGLIVSIFSIFNSKAKKWKQGRKNFFKSLPTTNNRDLYWFHCASLGEFDQALPLINLIKNETPSVFILVTFFSPSGFEHYHKRKHSADYVCYLPLDTPSNAFKFVNHFKPKKTFFVKYEFWANYIFEAKKQGSKIYSVSAIFRENQRFFKSKNSFFSNLLTYFDFFFVQNQESLDLLNSINIKNVIISGDTRFDRVIENKENIVLNPLIEKFKDNSKIWVIGSSWPEDELILFESINNNNIKVIIAPHDVSEKHIEQIESKLEIPSIRYSSIQPHEKINEFNVLILDTIGHLANAYKYGDFAYVGGGFSGNLHNILEPAVFGLPILLGPKHSKFPEADLFISKKIAFEVNSSLEVNNQIKKWIDTDLQELKLNIQKVVNNNKGASRKIIAKLAEI